ncbi:uncharacterized protein TRIVIDRAFT_198390 [Trichoderma virens Gv29-8]|uniref:Uncharacterized protein n=1 Tax=Hypocrea virens (strain Gv29-8 / FGSC 10586) TaxID=413071 RepID=G9MIV9_HYPVG|nr:uncharacterized protein TRIVIDRAFT_198390 [Trichoderma virens Gv29-8]EHK25425.1 hypothetical protein TRIVIDRAFT_198390 [Trichoderma virens Gv29-8]UKZ48755.1 hypothetical protein TrVGV298_002984 [Trichoderma virens]
MAAVVDPLRYNNLVSLGEADAARQAPFVDDTINGPIRDVFIKHGVQDIFCLYLQHRHHTIDEGQAVVKVNGTAHLMNGQAMNDIVAFGNKIVPTTWMTSGDEVIPMELTVAPLG